MIRAELSNFFQKQIGAISRFPKCFNMHLHDLTIKKFNQGLVNKEFTALEMVQQLYKFIEKKDKNIKIFAGYIPVKSAQMENYLNNKVPGIQVPENIINLMKITDDPQKTCIEISKDIISEIKAMKGIDGVHIMALGWEYLIPKMI